MEEDRPLITFLCADPKDAELKNYKKRVTMVLKKKAEMVQDGKRIKASSPKAEEPYELYIMGFGIPGHANNMLVFFAIVDKNFGVAHSIGKLYEDFKTQIFAAFDAKVLAKAKQTGDVHKKSQAILQGLCTKYGSNSISAASMKVEEVKNVMTQNIQIALDNGASLNDLEGKAADLNASSDAYKSKAKTVRRNACLDMVKAKAIFFLIAVIVLAIIVAVIYVVVK